MPPTIPNYPPPPTANADISGCETKAEVDVAELYTKLSSPSMEDEDAHIVHIVTKQALNINSNLYFTRLVMAIFLLQIVIAILGVQ